MTAAVSAVRTLRAGAVVAYVTDVEGNIDFFRAWVQRSRVVVDTLAGALAEAGDLTQALAGGAITPGHVPGELAQLLRGEIPGRQAPTDISLFKSVGTALEDLVAAELVLQAHRGGEAHSAPIDA